MIALRRQRRVQIFQERIQTKNALDDVLAFGDEHLIKWLHFLPSIGTLN